MIDYLLIDGTNLVHRVFHAVKGNNFDDPDLEVVKEAVYAMTMRLVNEWRVGPSRTIAAFDAGDGGRKALYPAYKANREHRDGVLRQALEEIPFQLGLRGVRPVAKPGWEADDVLATLASLAEVVRREVVIATGDKDLLQCLMPDEQMIWESQRQVLLLGNTAVQARCFGAQEFNVKYGFSPAYWPTYNALVGEPGDNIPGVPGIGPKKATALIQAYGGMSSIFDMLGMDSRPHGLNRKDAYTTLTCEADAFTYLRLTTLNRRVPGVCLEHD